MEWRCLCLFFSCFLGVFGFLVLAFVLSFVLVYNVLGVFWASLVPLLQEFWQDPLYILVSPIYLYIYSAFRKKQEIDGIISLNDNHQQAGSPGRCGNCLET